MKYIPDREEYKVLRETVSFSSEAFSSTLLNLTYNELHTAPWLEALPEVAS
jgi:hypothetical protein